MTIITVTIMGKQVKRKVQRDIDGERYIVFNYEKFLLSWHEDKVLFPISNNLIVWLHEKKGRINGSINHLHSLRDDSIANLKMLLHVMEREFEEQKDFLHTYYEVDACLIEQWIAYAKECLIEGKHQNTRRNK